MTIYPSLNYRREKENSVNHNPGGKVYGRSTAKPTIRHLGITSTRNKVINHDDTIYPSLNYRWEKENNVNHNPEILRKDHSQAYGKAIHQSLGSINEIHQHINGAIT